ncbi:predicted protein [Naegleria gruberi]|uniref:Predicted protein n=1 Tax=Naegleria gruberi TaxID=5762 RepID=D2VMC6_NAEGR|nr:uncharacterized protein NAEGRDRAFT_70086 [Naegleria gruberi]EFC41964.1 predicted protein [Naegleria gruberi]|eukprot:XP_002674708.1 predicted protein [Naegleria gruberi strain NEG-M]
MRFLDNKVDSPSIRNVMKLSRDDLRANLFPDFVTPTFSQEEEMMIDEWIKRTVRYFFHHHNNSKNKDDVLYVFVDGMCLNSNESVKSFETLCKGIGVDEKGEDETVKEIVQLTTTMDLPGIQSSNNTGAQVPDDHVSCEKLTRVINEQLINVESKIKKLASFYCVEVERDESDCKEAIEEMKDSHPAKQSRNYDKTKQEFTRLDEKYTKTINYKFVYNREDKLEEIVNDLTEWIRQND